MLRALNLQKSSGAHTVLRGVTLTVSRADRIGLVGANGAGKSTLLRLLAGESPDAGAVHTDPRVRVGFLPQELPECRGTLWEAAMDGAVEILSLTSRWRALADAMSQAPDDVALHDEYAAMQEAIERADGFTLEPRVRRTLRGLGLPEPLWNSPVRALSGGERTRLNLARTLIAVPDLLLLDEPTNHLDLSAIEWLETFLAGFRGAVVVASHDRRLLNSVARRILQLEDGIGREHRGNYDAYRAARLGELAAQAEAYNRYRQEVERIREFTRRQLGRAAAVQKGPNRGSDHRGRVARKMAKRAQAARSRLERMETAAPGRPRAPDRIELSLAAPRRLGPTVANARALTKTFGDRVLFAGVNLTLGRGDRVGVVGPNGAGKTTLLRLLVGYDKPTSGEVTLGPSVRAAMLSQNHEVPQDTRRVLDVAMDLGFALPEARALLAALLFRGDRVFQRLCDLSIGETIRLRLLELLANETNLLVLDEPTNHLDLESRERLEEALDAYAGTLVIASHDRFLLDRFCTSTWAIESGGVHVFDGNYTASRTDRRMGAGERGHGEDESGR